MKMIFSTTLKKDGTLSPNAFAEREDGYRTGVDLLTLDDAGWEAQKSAMPMLSEAERAETLANFRALVRENAVAPREEVADPVLTYAQKRRQEYPNYADQLEMIYKAVKAGDPNLTEFVAAIDAVRAKHPKD